MCVHIHHIWGHDHHRRRLSSSYSRVVSINKNSLIHSHDLFAGIFVAFSGRRLCSMTSFNARDVVSWLQGQFVTAADAPLIVCGWSACGLHSFIQLWSCDLRYEPRGPFAAAAHSVSIAGGGCWLLLSHLIESSVFIWTVFLSLHSILL